jgi:hypothetical protein
MAMVSSVGQSVKVGKFVFMNMFKSVVVYVGLGGKKTFCD